jgi:hypothetical protein
MASAKNQAPTTEEATTKEAPGTIEDTLEDASVPVCDREIRLAQERAATADV